MMIKTLLLTNAFLLTSLLATPIVRAADPPPTAAAAVRQYYEWLLRNLDAIEADLPAITAAAEAAAERYATGEWQLAAAGDYGVLSEACGRSGGIMGLKWGYPFNYLKRKPDDKFIVLFALREDHYAEYLKNIRESLADDNIFLVVMGPEHLIERARADNMPMDTAFTVQAAENEGLFPTSDGKWAVPTTPPASMAALWCWTSEFVAACTRQGKMPVMHESYAIPGAKERAEKLKGKRFYDEDPVSVEPGVLARQFLTELRDDLNLIRINETEKLLEAVNTAWEARERGHNLYTFVHGHAIVMQQVDYPNSPGYLRQINKNWFEQNPKIELSPGDFVFCLGYSQRFNGGRYGTWDEDARQTGATLVWSLADYEKEDIEDIEEKGEPIINQHWEYGDAVVDVPGFPFKISPTSGHIAQAMLRLFNAGLLGREQESKSKDEE